MKTLKRWTILMRIVLAALCITGCTKNIVTGKSQLSLIPERELQEMSLVQYRAFIAQSNVVKTPDKNAVLVQEVGKKISDAVGRYFNLNNISNALDGYQWEYNLVKDSAVNAWCMPGGKIVVYTGILPVTINPSALAVVMGHEVSHAILDHGNRRMSESILQQTGGLVLSAALAKKPVETRNIFLQAYGVSSELGVMLPFSRKQELEADRYGLIFASMAGYDVDEAIRFWERMQRMSGSSSVPEFLSTHPSNETRVKKIKQYLPEAKSFSGK